MRSTFLSMLVVCGLGIGCGDSASEKKDSHPDPSTGGDAGKQPADATSMGEMPSDSGMKPPEDCDKPETPGNDCSDAVGCRGSLSCGLETQSCCVKGLDVSGVACQEGLVCPAEFGRASCDGPEDCDGQACCVDTVAGTTECLPDCETKIALCHTDDDCVEGKSCSQGKTFSWWGICL